MAFPRPALVGRRPVARVRAGRAPMRSAASGCTACGTARRGRSPPTASTATARRGARTAPGCTSSPIARSTASWPRRGARGSRSRSSIGRPACISSRSKRRCAIALRDAATNARFPRAIRWTSRPGAVNRRRAGPGTIDFDGLAARVSDVPLVPGNYASLDTDGQRLYFLSWDAGDSGPQGAAHDADRRHARAGDARRSTSIATSCRSTRSTLLLVRGDDLLVLPADGSRAHRRSIAAKVAFGDWTLTVQPRDEWRQIFVDAWRQQRDGFYDRRHARRRLAARCGRATSRCSRGSPTVPSSAT